MCKKKLNYMFKKDLEVNKIIDLHRYAYTSNKKIFLLLIHSLYLLFFKKYKLSVKKNKKKVDVLFFKNLHRSDYDLLFKSIEGQCYKDKAIVESDISYGLDWGFVFEIKENIKYFYKINAKSTIERLYLFFSFMFYTKMIKYLKKYEFKYLVVFADMQPVDNLVSQYFHNLQKKTITLQHGLFVDYEGTYNISSVSYENVVSDHFLTWGEGNKRLIERYNPDCNVVVCGNPSIRPYVSKYSGMKFFTVFFDWDVFRVENEKMLDIAYQVSDKLNIKFNLRFHPSNDISSYKVNEKYIVRDVDYRDSYFMLGHTSSMIHICQRLGLLVFKFDSVAPTNPVNSKYLFKESNDILEKLNYFGKVAEKHKKNIGPIGEESLKKYNNFFSNL